MYRGPVIVAGTFLVSLCLGAVAWSVAGPMRSEAQPVAAREEVLLIGPLSVGELYKNMTNQEWRKKIPEGGGPSDEEIIAALAKCKLYIIDKVRISEKD